MPDELKTPVYTGKLFYSFHAYNASKSDRYGDIKLPEYFLGQGSLIETEIELTGSAIKVVKQVWRTSYDSMKDLSLVIMFSGKVKTVWLNMKNDLHKTLDLSKYTHRPQSV